MQTLARWGAAPAICVWILSACGGGDAVPVDAGLAAVADAGGWDAGPPDAGAPMRILDVRLSGDGTGVVRSDDGSIECGDGMTRCAVARPEGTVMTLTAEAVGPSVFAGWSGPGLECDGTGPCTFVLTSSRQVTASFDLDELSLMVTTSGGGSGAVTSSPAGIDCGETCAASFTAFTEVTLTVTAASSSVFAGWTGACAGTDPTCTVALGEAKSVDAAFELRDVTLTVQRTGDGAGSISYDSFIACGDTCSATFTWGTAVTLIATADTGTSIFAGWTGCTSTDATCVTTLEEDTLIGASFMLRRHDLTVTPGGAGIGTVTSDIAGIDCGATCTGTYPHGTSVTLTAAPDGGTSTFGGWGGACASATGTTCTLDVMAASEVTADFDLQTRDLTVGTSGLGTGAVTSAPAGIDCGTDCTEPYPYGTSVALTATPDPSTSVFVEWSGACTPTDAPTCTVEMTLARTVTALFDLAPRELTVTVDGAGTGTVVSSPTGIECGLTGSDCAASFRHGASVQLSASPGSGSSFAGWGGACAGAPFVTCTVSMDAAKGVTATFD